MSDEKTVTGRDPFHLGWLEPGRTACLGAGPAKIRMTRAEAQWLSRELARMLRTPEGARQHYPACGCESEVPDLDEAMADIAAQFRE